MSIEILMAIAALCSATGHLGNQGFMRGEEGKQAAARQRACQREYINCMRATVMATSVTLANCVAKESQ